MRALLHKISVALYAFGPVGVLVLGVIDSVGIPLPDAVDFFVIAVAAESVHNPAHAWFTAFMALIGSLIGNVALFQAARHGRRLFGKSGNTPAKPSRFHNWFYRYGLASIFVPAMVPVPLPLKVFVISAGALQTPFSRFLAVIISARTIRYFGEAYLGLRLGQDAQGFLIRNGWTLAGVALAVAFAIVWLLKVNERRTA